MSLFVFAPILIAATLQGSVLKVESIYDSQESRRLVPMLSEVLRFPTSQFDAEGHQQQKEWLEKTAHDLGFVYRDAGPVSEIELPAAPDAPVLGLMVHGDVQPVEAEAWSFGPYSGKADDTYVYGRGSADDKGPLVQALLAMKALKESGIDRTHTVRLLVGSDEESTNNDVTTYLKSHQPPDYTLVLDSNFPVVVGEKAWNSLTLTTKPYAERPGNAKPYSVFFINAGLGASIVPDRAEVKLKWNGNTSADWAPLMTALRQAKLPEDTRLAMKEDSGILWVVAYGTSAHAGMNLEGGRNALVALARVLDGKLPSGGADDLLSFVRMAGQDLYGSGLGITDRDPVWGRYAVNIATIKQVAEDESRDESRATLTINVRRIPPRTGPQLQSYLAAFVADFNKRTGASLVAGGFYDDEPLGFDPKSKIVTRLLADYAAATGEKNPKPAISGGGTYAKRLPSSIAFGMWFPDKPYPGHDVNEKNPIADLQKGTHVLIRAIVDIATGPKIVDAFKP